MNTTTMSTIPSTEATPAVAEAPTEQREQTVPDAPVPDGAPAEPNVDPAFEMDKKEAELANRFTQIARREAKARQQQAEIQQLRAEAESHKTKFEKMVREFEDDPVAWLEANKKDPVEFVKRITRPVSEEEKRLRALEEERAAEKREREEEKTRAEQQQAERAKRQQLMKFVGETDPEKFPYMTARWEPQELGGAIAALLNEPHDASDPRGPSVIQVFRSKHGRDPWDSELREALEARAEEYATRFSRVVRPAQQLATDEKSTTANGLSAEHAAQSSGGSTRTKSREERIRDLKRSFEGS